MSDRAVFLGRRDEVALRLLLDTGVRVSELCGLEITDVDLDRELAYVTGTGSRPRVVPFGAKTAQAVDRYLRVRALHPYARSTRPLLGQRGPMTPDGARDVLHLRAAQAGVADVHPHRFRHTSAHRWLTGGGQERDLMMLAGWSSDDMLSRYAASTAAERAHDAHRRLGLGHRLRAGGGREAPVRAIDSSGKFGARAGSVAVRWTGASRPHRARSRAWAATAAKTQPVSGPAGSTAIHRTTGEALEDRPEAISPDLPAWSRPEGR